MNEVNGVWREVGHIGGRRGMGTVIAIEHRRRLVLAMLILGICAVFGVWLFNLTGSSQAVATDSASIPQSEKNWIVDDAGAAQQAALADMSVSRQEYVAAVDAVRQCMADAGVATSEPVWEGGQLHFEFGGTGDRAGLAPMKAVYKDCNDRFLVGIATGWAIGSSPAR